MAEVVPFPPAAEACWTRRFSSWVEPYLTPKQWVDWSALATISGVVERRVWTETGIGRIYPSVFFFLVGPPANGKSQIIKATRYLWAAAQSVNIAPDSMTKSALVDFLKEGHRVLSLPEGPEVYHAVGVGVSEFDVFMPQHDQAFLSHCCLFWDCEDRPFGEKTRSGGDVQIDNPCLTLLAGIQPGVMHRTFPETAWSQGFMTRCVFSYADEAPKESLFDRPQQDTRLGQNLVRDLKRMHDRTGLIPFHKDAAKAIDQWHMDGCPPAPTHPRLVGYNARRALQVIKIGLLYAISREHEAIFENDIADARRLLINSEEHIGDMLHALVTSDRSHEDIYHATYEQIRRAFVGSGKPVAEAVVRRIIMGQTSNPQLVDAFLNNLTKAGILEQTSLGGLPAYKPGVYKEIIV